MQIRISLEAGAFLDSLPKISAAGKCYDLGQQQRQKQSCSIQPKSSSIGGSHIDNGVNPVDKEEKGDQEKEDLLFLF